MSDEQITIKDLLKGKKWKEFLKSIFASKDSEIVNRYNEALELYGEELKQHKKEVLAEMEKIDRLYETELLRYIAKTLFTIKDKLERRF